METTPVPRGNAGGFTLIELAIALTVAALLVTLAMPSMQDFQQRQRMIAAANDLVAHINVARIHAVTHREVTIVCPSADGLDCSGDNRWDRGWVVFRDPDRDGHPDGPDDVLRVGQSLAHLRADSGGRKRLRYLPTGMAYGTNQTIKLCDRREVAEPRAVVVSNTGRPRVDALPDHLECV